MRYGKNIILITHMAQEDEFKFRWWVHAQPPQMLLKNFGDSLSLLLSTATNLPRQKLCHETLHLSLSSIIQKSSPTESISNLH